MRVIMLGTGPFAVPSFKALVADPGVSVIELVTRPVPPAKGRRKSPANPMRDAALELNVPTFEPERINRDEAVAHLRDLHADLLVVCDYGQILKTRVLETARLGGINLHGSLLPKYRGAAPIQWALYHGETETGVTVIEMTEGLDAGPIVELATEPILPKDDGETLEDRLAKLGSQTLLNAVHKLNGVEDVGAIATAQDDAAATLAPRIQKSDGRIDWTRPAAAILNQIRAFKPWPASYTFVPQAKGPALRLIIDEANVVQPQADESAAETHARPGTVLAGAAGSLSIQTGDGTLLVRRLQPAGKRVMDAGEFLRGHAIPPGTPLADSAEAPEL